MAEAEEAMRQPLEAVDPFFWAGRMGTTIRPESYVCPACGAAYPAGPGICKGRGEDAHAPRQAVRR